MRQHRRPAVRALGGRITVPGDKSISHRGVVLAALARGRSAITGLNTGADVQATISAVSALGTGVDFDEDNAQLKVDGYGFDGLSEPGDVLDCGNSGTTLRTTLGILAGIPGYTVVTGDDSLRRRPMLRVVAPLRQMGARIDGRAYGNLPPLAVRGGDLHGLDIDINVASAQIKTALLLAGLRADGTTSVTEPALSRDHTERMLAAAGVEVRREGLTVSVAGGTEPAVLDRAVPGDVSAAMFFVVAAALVPGSHLEIGAVGLNPTRTAAFDVLRDMGADIEIETGPEQAGEPVGTVRVSASRLHGVDVDPELVPRLIDEVPALAIAAAQAEGETVISGAEELRVKESDRIAGLVEGLRAVGGDAEERPDGLVIRGPARLAAGEIDSRGDHRIAMAFAIAGLLTEGRIRVRGWRCVETSFPDFLDVLGRAQGKPA